MQGLSSTQIESRPLHTLFMKSRRWLAPLYRCVSGNISVEFALILPFLLLLVMGVYDFGRGFMEKNRLISAARAGAQYALAHPSANDNALYSGVTQSARDDAADVDGILQVVPNPYRKCLDDVEVGPDESCAGGEVPMRYIEVDVSGPFEFLFDYPMTTGSMILTGHAELRVR